MGSEDESGLGKWAVWVCRINASCVRKDFGYVIPGEGGLDRLVVFGKF